MADLNLIHQEIAAVASTISGMRGASPWEVDTIPVTPYAVVGMSRATVITGDRTVTNIEFPLRLYVERVGSGDRDAQLTNSFIGTYQTSFASNGGLHGAVTHIYISGWDADRYYLIGSATYAAVDFVLTATVHEHISQSLGYG